MHPRTTRLQAWAGAPLAGLAAGCVVAAAGAGAGGGIYFTQRGVESVVPASVDRAAAATARAFEELKIRQTKATTEQADNGGQKREIDGTGADRDISVTITSEGNTTRVQVVAKKSAVTWDKDFARAVLDKIVAYSR
ncbi:MAG TPA: DUF3568 family protein [Gemmatimonadales bacterium]|nr:DUF3568 family protein [Gemmatimonadales bacterium]